MFSLSIDPMPPHLYDKYSALRSQRQELLAQHLAGNEQAFIDLCDSYRPMITIACRRILGDRPEVEDAVQETLITLCEHAADIRDNPDAWVFRSATNKALNLSTASQRRHKRETLASSPAQVVADQQFPVDDEEQLDLLRCCLEDIDAPQRQLLYEHFYQARSYSQIAQQTGVSKGAVKKRMDKALDTLRERLQQRGVQATALLLLPWLFAVHNTAALYGAENVAAPPAPATRPRRRARSHRGTTGQRHIALAVSVFLAAAFLLAVAFWPASTPPPSAQANQQAGPPATPFSLPAEQPEAATLRTMQDEPTVATEEPPPDQQLMRQVQTAAIDPATADSLPLDSIYRPGGSPEHCHLNASEHPGINNYQGDWLRLAPEWDIWSAPAIANATAFAPGGDGIPLWDRFSASDAGVRVDSGAGYLILQHQQVPAAGLTLSYRTRSLDGSGRCLPWFHFDHPRKYIDAAISDMPAANREWHSVEATFRKQGQTVLVDISVDDTPVMHIKGIFEEWQWFLWIEGGRSEIADLRVSPLADLP